jgi:hypothetical protein
MMENQINIRELWDKVVNEVKLRVIHPTLWRTLELAVPITIEDNQFIVGMPPGSFHLSGHMTSSEHKNAIEKAITQFSGLQLNLRVIDGVTYQDWIQVKRKDESLQAIKEAAQKKREAETAVTKSWEGLLETVSRRYANTPYRQLPQFRARYLVEMLKIISEAMDELMPEGRIDELAERSLARVIEKVATLTEVPAPIIALELLRYRRK